LVDFEVKEERMLEAVGSELDKELSKVDRVSGEDPSSVLSELEICVGRGLKSLHDLHILSRIYAFSCARTWREERVEEVRRQVGEREGRERYHQFAEDF
jgi:hypothetical protein